MFALKQAPPQRKAPKAWLPKLSELVLVMGHESICTTEALCAAITRDPLAGLVLQDLLMLMPKGIRKDGAVWKSDRHWQAHRGISYWRMRRIRSSLSVVVDHWKENAQGAPTYHYKLNTRALICEIARVFGRTEAYIQGLLYERLENGQPANAGFEAVTQKSITDDSLDSLNDDESDHQNQKVVSVSEATLRLLNVGLAVHVAQGFAEIPLDVIEAKIAAAAGTRNPAGYITTSLRNWLRDKSAERREQVSNRPYFEQYAPTADDLTPPPNPLSQRDAEQPTSGEGDVETEAAALDEDTARLFEMVMLQIEAQLDRGSFNSVYGAKLLEAGERWVIQVRNEHAQAACEGRLNRSIVRIVRGVAGAAVGVTFTC